MSGSVYPCQHCGTNRWTNEEVPCPKCGATRTKDEQTKDVERLQLRQFEAVKQPRKKIFRIYFTAPDCKCGCTRHEECCGIESDCAEAAKMQWISEFEPDKRGLVFKEIFDTEPTLAEQITSFEAWQKSEGL